MAKREARERGLSRTGVGWEGWDECYFEHLPLLRQVYHEAPDDVFELIASNCSGIYGRGGLNASRLANKSLKQVVESCTTKLTNRHREDGPDSLPIPIIHRGGMR